MSVTQPIPAFSIFGPPGCGKGTQAGLIKERLGYLHVSTGDIFRAAIARQDPNALKAKELMERGELVPDEVIRDMLQVELKNILDNANDPKGVILDGFPRSAGQSGMLDDVVKALNLRFTGAVSLLVEEDILVDRLAKRAEIENRSDDTEEVIRERMRVYREKTQPLEDFFSGRDQLIGVDGLGTVEDVYERLVPIINSWG